MVRQDILNGLKNAIERGYNLEQAKQSFINAGYNPEEVEAAAAQLTSASGALHLPQSVATVSSRDLKKSSTQKQPARRPAQQKQPVQQAPKTQAQQLTPKQPARQPAQKPVQPTQPKEPTQPAQPVKPLPETKPLKQGRSVGGIILIIILVIVLLSLIGFLVGLLVARDEIINFITGIFG